MNLSRAWVTSANAKLEVGDVDRDELVSNLKYFDPKSNIDPLFHIGWVIISTSL